MRKGKIYLRTVALYFSGILLLGIVFLLEYPRSSAADFSESDKPGKDRLFVPIKLAKADSLFTSLVNGRRNSVKEEDGQLVIRGKLDDLLDRNGMGPDIWNELLQTDTLMVRKPGELRLSIETDPRTGERYVNVPAGLSLLFIK